MLHRRQGGVRPSARSSVSWPSVSWPTDERGRRFYSGAWHFPAAPRSTPKRQRLSGQFRTRTSLGCPPRRSSGTYISGCWSWRKRWLNWPPPQRPPIKNRGGTKCQQLADRMAKNDLCIPCFSLVGGGRNVPAHSKLRQVKGSTEDELFQCDTCNAWWSIRKLGWDRLFRLGGENRGIVPPTLQR